MDDEESDGIFADNSPPLQTNSFVGTKDYVDSNIGEDTNMLDAYNEPTKCFNLEPHQRCGLCGLQVFLDSS